MPLIRMTFVPAVMALLGDKAWWLPRWLDQLLPTFDIEGEVLTRQLALADWPGNDSVLYSDQLEVDSITPPIAFQAVAGNVICLEGPVGARTGTALMLSGRLQATSGRARVAGSLLPDGAARVRRYTSYLDLSLLSEPVAALDRVEAPPGGVAFVDSVDVLGTPDELAALVELAQRVRSKQEIALFLCAASREHLSNIQPDAVLCVTSVAREGSAL